MTLVESLGKLDELDFRVKGRCRYRASEIALVTLCALVAGGTSHYDFADFGREKTDWLRSLHGLDPRLTDFRNGTPSHDAFRYAFSVVDHGIFSACLRNVAGIAAANAGGGGGGDRREGGQEGEETRRQDAVHRQRMGRRVRNRPRGGEGG